MTKSVAHALTVTLLLGGCATGVEDGVPAEPAQRQLQTPSLRSVAPTAIRAGDELTIFGADFADEQLGQVQLTFEGVYQTSASRTRQVSLEVVPKFKNQGVLTWEFGPNIPFGVEEVGSFRGILRARNVGRDGQVKEANVALGVEMQVLPSIIVRQLRPAGQGCAAGVTETTDSTKMLMELEAIGLKSGTDLAPLRFIYTFMKDSFQFNGYLSSQLGVDPESLFPKSGPVSVVDEVRNGFVSTLGSGSPRKVQVFQGSTTSAMAGLAGGLENLFSMTDLITAPLPDAQDSREASLDVVAVDSSGQEARRAIRFTVWAPVQVRYDGADRVVRTYDPVPVSGCLAGGDIGRDVTYAESSSETRQRTFTVHAKVGGGIDIKVVRLNAEFGVDVQAQVSTSSAKSLTISGKVLPKEFGVFYRQTIQLERRASLIGHGLCGGTQDLGDVVVTDWTWSPDLAKGPTCPALPPSNLAPGQEFN